MCACQRQKVEQRCSERENLLTKAGKAAPVRFLSAHVAPLVVCPRLQLLLLIVKNFSSAFDLAKLDPNYLPSFLPYLSYLPTVERSLHSVGSDMV